MRDDFGPESDVDVFVTLRPDASWTLFDLSRMQEELTQLFGRNVDLLTRRGVESSRNGLLRDAILSSAKMIHAA